MPLLLELLPPDNEDIIPTTIDVIPSVQLSISTTRLRWCPST